MELNMLIKDLVREIRFICDITQTTLSKWTDIDQGSLSQYENGSRKPGLRAKKKLLEIANKKAGMNLKYSDLED